MPVAWLILALLVAVIGGRVAGDYSRRHQELSRDRARDHVAAARGLKAHMQFGDRYRDLRIRFNQQPVRLPTQLEVQFRHATRKGVDRKITLTRAPDGTYRTLLPKLADGEWQVQLAADDWRLLGVLLVPVENTVAFAPPP
jgi:hypothetical protein